MPRPSNPEVRKRLLAAGLDLIHLRGFAASGVKEITDAAGVPKGSFYAYFPSKEAFASAILDAFNRAHEPKKLVFFHGGHFDAYVRDQVATATAARDWYLQHLA